MDILSQFTEILPLAIKWAEVKERDIIEEGIPLSKQQLIDAVHVGVSYPERIRILIVTKIRPPEHPLLKQAIIETQLMTPDTAGLTLRYGIFIRSDQQSQRHVLAHEFAHVAQYEKLGGIPEFLQQYLKELFTHGYQEAPMEQEAIRAESLIT